VVSPSKISWELNLEDRYPYGGDSPDPARFEPLGFPPPWPDRPWVYANFIISDNGIVAWSRADYGDDPIRAIAGGDPGRPARRADVELMRYLRASADAVAVGAQTLRDQPELTDTLGSKGNDLGQVLERFRRSHGRSRLPRQVIYTRGGVLDLNVRMFNTPGAEVIVVTTERGARQLRARGSDDKGVRLLIAGEGDLGPDELTRAHQILFTEYEIRYLDCEGGATILAALHGAGLVDEIFLTLTDVRIDTSRHEGVKRLPPLANARLIAEGRVLQDAAYVFRRWRLSER